MQKVTNKILLIILFFSVITVSFAGGLEDKANKIVYEKELDFKNVPFCLKTIGLITGVLCMKV